MTDAAEVTEVSRLELFFDLVFVFTITQFTTLLTRHATATGAAQTAVMLAIVWWMYGGYAWLTNLVPPDRAARRIAMVCGMASYLVLALTIPRAFHGEGLTFGLAYLLVVLVHGGLFTVSTRPSLAIIYRGFFPVNVAFAVIVIVGGALGGTSQYVLWTLAACAEWISPRLIPDQSHLLRAHHFVERHALVVLVALGESVVAVGIGASATSLDPATLTAIALGMGMAGCLWWAYFGADDDLLRERGFVHAIAIGRRLVGVRAFGLVFVALLGAVVAFAAGVRHGVAAPGSHLGAPQALELGGGAALFLVADQLSRAAMALGISTMRMVTALAAVCTVPIGMVLPAGVQEGALIVVLAASFVVEQRATGSVPVS
ncbi:MAG TPA: low temperature requirement protein A [Gaiellales bacterium]|nr:low temperature requirement protein A [Gaiellales bacterium]